MSVFFTVILKLKLPWTDFVSQKDGTEFTANSEKKKTIRSLDDSENSISEQSMTAQSNSSISVQESPSLSAVTILEEETRRPGSDYVVRVLVPCYKEDLHIVKSTCIAALNLNYDKSRLFVYLLDDGGDPAKKQWVKSHKMTNMAKLEYVCRPEIYKGHGKSGNLNYALQHIIYSSRGKQKIPKNELVVIFDADMTCVPHFLDHLLPYFKENPNVVMVQSPQTFHNMPMKVDFFDSHNVNFFQYMLPAMSAWNTTTCCGTNFIVSARALASVKWFPTISVTEDMYLAIKLLENGGVIQYHPEHLVVGEAPVDLRQIFQQRSRWAKGTIQIAIKDNPLFSSKLNWIQRLAFFNACWSYITSAFMNPLFVLINAVGIVFGMFPVKQIDFSTAMLFAIYYSLFYAMIHFTPVPGKHYKSLWVVGKMGHFFSYMSLKAILNVAFRSKDVDFKVTQKNVIVDNAQARTGKYIDSPTQDSKSSEGEKQTSRDSSHRDIVFHWIMCSLIVFVIWYGLRLISGGNPFLPDLKDERSLFEKRGIRLFCICWMFQFLIAYSLPLWYAYLPSRHGVHSLVLKILAIIDTILTIGLIVLTILLFQLNWQRLPEIDSITEFPPAQRAFWFTDTSSRRDVTDYITAKAMERTIPIIVVYARPGRDEGLLSEGGVASMDAYESLLKSLGSTIRSTYFPVAVVLEPDWLFETMNSVAEPSEGAQVLTTVEIVNPITGIPQINFIEWKPDRWFSLTTIFKDFAERMIDKSYVYVDGGHPFYHAFLGRNAFQQIRDSIQNSKIRGLSVNVSNFYNNTDLIKFSAEITSNFDFKILIDSSRNAGFFSNRGWEAIDSCRFDPPDIGYGISPQWVFDDYLKAQGIDAYMYVKVPGESDGRMFKAGVARDCLMYHNIECSAECPEIPIDDFRPRSCQC